MTFHPLQKKSLLSFFLLFLSSCAQGPISPGKIQLERLSFEDISGWKEDKQIEAFYSFSQSCEAFQRKPSKKKLLLDEAGTYADWQKICANLPPVLIKQEQEARQFFEENFTPYRIATAEQGLFTGYYEATLRGSKKQSATYAIPLWQKPRDLIRLDLSAFPDVQSSKKLTGKVVQDQFVPYDKRKEIAAWSLKDRSMPLVWVDKAVDAFFLEIQGSGRVLLDDGTCFRVGYDAQNGHAYTPIGRVLADNGDIDRPVTMQKIRSWLTDHPEQAQEIMNKNESVVFFKQSDKEGAVGALGVVLTPGRSLAVDPAYIPLGIPLWLQTTEIQRLVIAQDTGGAIKGAIRGDVFWGAGDIAEEQAGRMQDRGSYILLLPKKDAS